MAQLPKYEHVKQDLLKRIHAGDFTPDKPIATQRGLCESYGVSMLTAARALNELQQDGVLVRRRGQGTFVAPAYLIEAPATDIGNKRIPSSPTLTCIVPSLASGDVIDVLRGVEQAATRLGFTIVIANCEGSWTRQHDALVRAATTDAVVLYPVDGASDVPAVRQLNEAGVPVVFADRYWPEFPCAAVTMDNYEIGRRLASGLINRGFQHVGALWVETDCTSVRDRQSGHMRALQSHGLDINSDLFAMRNYLSESADARYELLSSTINQRGPTGFICANGFVLEQALNDALDRGLRIAEDIDFAGTDRKVGTSSRVPPLTAVTAVLPQQSLGEKAAQIACQAASTGEHPRPSHIVLPAEFHERENLSTQLYLVKTPS